MSNFKKEENVRILFMAGAVLLSMLGAAFAAEPASAAAGVSLQAGGAAFFSSTAIAVIVGLGIAAAGCGVGMGIAVSRALEGIARQPEAASKIQLNMFIGAALIESLVLYTLFIGIVLLYANPFMKYFVK
jgi:F-type H+-transporting ATPase subunit c